MELVKRTVEEQAKIDRDKSMPHCSIVVLAPLTITNIFQEEVSTVLERGMGELKRRADAAKMIILSTSISTNTLTVEGLAYLMVMILCQWAEIEKLEEQQRRAILAGSTGPRRGA